MNSDINLTEIVSAPCPECQSEFSYVSERIASAECVFLYLAKAKNLYDNCHEFFEATQARLVNIFPTSSSNIFWLVT
jgi:hypothetical protein